MSTWCVCVCVCARVRVRVRVCVCDLQHSMGLEEACRDTVLPLGWVMCTRNTILTRVFLRPMSVSPLRSSMSEFLSFRMPAQSMLSASGEGEEEGGEVSP